MVHVYCLVGKQVSSCSVECTAPFVSVPDHVEDTKQGSLWYCSPLNIFVPFRVGILLCWRQHKGSRSIWNKCHFAKYLCRLEQRTLEHSAMSLIWCCKQQRNAPTYYNRTRLADKLRWSFLFFLPVEVSTHSADKQRICFSSHHQTTLLSPFPFKQMRMCSNLQIWHAFTDRITDYSSLLLPCLLGIHLIHSRLYFVLTVYCIGHEKDYCDLLSTVNVPLDLSTHWLARWNLALISWISWFVHLW